MTRSEFRERIDAIEESYEFFLAYAAQGLTGETAKRSSGELRRFLGKLEEALNGLGAGFAELVASEELAPREAYEGMARVLDRDAESTLAAVRIVSAQDPVTSQLIDNLNASIHIRALLTDLFILDEVLEVQQTQ